MGQKDFLQAKEILYAERLTSYRECKEQQYDR